MSKCSLDIIINCALGLEVGLRKYPKIADELPAHSIEFITNWNQAMIHIAKKPEFAKNLSVPGRIMSHMPYETIRKIAGVMTPSYRHYYYAKRFTEAYKTAQESLYTDDKNVDKAVDSSQSIYNVLDYGRGLSPLLHLLQSNHSHISILGKEIDHDSNKIEANICHALGIKSSHPVWNIKHLEKVAAHTTVLSLGTFTYIPKELQITELMRIKRMFPHFFIELNMELTELHDGDSRFMRKLFGTGKYIPLPVAEIQSIFGKTMPIIMPDFDTKNLPNNIVREIHKASECFVRQ